ncbi:MAG: energy transducer TonB [Deltaproteobacteria bacterium]|nr:energy transducer TonB [Deltaproteobacteria bacterium]
MRAALFVIGLALFATTASAQTSSQTRVPTGADLAAMLPARLGRAPRWEVSTYSRFVNAAYTLRGGGRASLQLHEVIGAGSEAFQRTDCPRPITIARRAVCLRVRDDFANLSWVLDDVIQVILSAPDEARVVQLARALNLAPYVRLAARLRAAGVDDAHEEASGEQAMVVGSAATHSAPTTPPLPRPRVVSIAPPTYPTAAREQGLEGIVSVRVDVAADGTLTRASVLGGDAVFHEAALASVRSATFEPARDAEGHAVPSMAVVRVRFALD